MSTSEKKGAAAATGKPAAAPAAQRTATPPAAAPTAAATPEAPKRKRGGMDKVLARFIVRIADIFKKVSEPESAEQQTASLAALRDLLAQALPLAQETGGRALVDINTRLAAAGTELKALSIVDTKSAAKGKELMSEIQKLLKKKAAIEGDEVKTPPPATV